MYIESFPTAARPRRFSCASPTDKPAKLRKRTLANLSKWPRGARRRPAHPLEGRLRRLRLVPSLPGPAHSPPWACCGRLGNPAPPRVRALTGHSQQPAASPGGGPDRGAHLEPRSKLATARGWDPQTLSSSLGELLRVEAATADDLYGALVWLLARQPKIENRLAGERLHDGCLVLYDVTSTYFEGGLVVGPVGGIPETEKGHAGKIVFGLLCDRQGCPVAVEVFGATERTPPQ